MLLIGSRAARFHFPSARKPKDFDFIATPEEVKDFLKNFSYKDISSHAKKVRALVNVHGEKVTFEFDLTTSYVSSQFIYDHEKHFLKEDSLLDQDYYVASPQTLYLLKRSHITFPIHWEKNIEDFLYLKSKVDDMTLPAWWNYAFRTRFEEIVHRVSKNRKKMNFDVKNSEFFNKSEKFVKRVVEHDSLHYATCFYDKPIFLSVKDDISKAALSSKLVSQLSHEDKIKMIQEECMALSMERQVIPALMKKETIHAPSAYKKIAGKMVYNYLPEFLRFFAADHFKEILDLKFDYVQKCLDNHPTLNKIIQQVP